jgi:DtxR family Mn-dependent transcriptional regulator
MGIRAYLSRIYQNLCPTTLITNITANKTKNILYIKEIIVWYTKQSLEGQTMRRTPIEYLREIYRSYEEGLPIVGPTHLSKAMNVNKATAYEALNNLAKMGWGTYVKGKGFVLNERGIEVARIALRKHRLLECYLADTLEISLGDICDEVSIIDTHVGDAVILALEERYGEEKKCPCGNEIPKNRKEGKSHEQ